MARGLSSLILWIVVGWWVMYTTITATILVSHGTTFYDNYLYILLHIPPSILSSDHAFNDKVFDGSTALLRPDKLLRTIIGKVTRFPVFRPRSVPEMEIVEVLPLQLLRHNICCHLSVTIAPNLAEIFNSFNSVSVCRHE